uniref:Uncharacterized protein n=1 Tax=Mycena chlorophos TaxID=658473 RepID=A0ABQ0L8Y3_MYCCL|nr:predicted protein [Mycena chlorophos]
MPPEGFVVSPRRVPDRGVALLKAKFEFKNNPPSANEQKAVIERMLKKRPGGLTVTSPPSSPNNTRSRMVRRLDASPSKLPVAKKQKKSDADNADYHHEDEDEGGQSDDSVRIVGSRTLRRTRNATPASNRTHSRPGPATSSSTSSVAPSSTRSTSAFTPTPAPAGANSLRSALVPSSKSRTSDPFTAEANDEMKPAERRVSFVADDDIDMEDAGQVKVEVVLGKGKGRAAGERPETPIASSSKLPVSITKIPSLSVAQKIQLAGQAQTAQELQLRQDELEMRRQELEFQRGRLAFLLDLHRTGQLAQLSLVLRAE